jgi:hypothetical protein
LIGQAGSIRCVVVPFVPCVWSKNEAADTEANDESGAY